MNTTGNNNYQIIKVLNNGSHGSTTSSGAFGGGTTMDQQIFIIHKGHSTKALKKVLCHSEEELNKSISEGWKLRHLTSCPYIVEIEDIFFEKMVIGSSSVSQSDNSMDVSISSSSYSSSVAAQQMMMSGRETTTLEDVSSGNHSTTSTGSTTSSNVENHRYWICFQMEYFKHGDLSQYFKKKRKTLPRSSTETNSHTLNTTGSVFEIISRDQLLLFMLQIAEGIEYLHSQKFVHLDLKPQNIFVTNDEKSIKIGDFETMRQLTYSVEEEPTQLDRFKDILAKNEDTSNITDLSWCCGTIKYMSPVSDILLLAC